MYIVVISMISTFVMILENNSVHVHVCCLVTGKAENICTLASQWEKVQKVELAISMNVMMKENYSHH